MCPKATALVDFFFLFPSPSYMMDWFFAQPQVHWNVKRGNIGLSEVEEEGGNVTQLCSDNCH